MAWTMESASWIISHFYDDEDLEVAFRLLKQKSSDGKGKLRARRTVIHRDVASGHVNIVRDYLGDTPTYTDEVFERRFLVPRSLFRRILEVFASRGLLAQGVDATGKPGATREQKVIAALRMMQSGAAMDLCDDYCRLAESTTRAATRSFCQALDSVFGPYFLRRPTISDVVQIYRQHATRGFPGLLGSIDCTHWVWKACARGNAGQYKGKEKRPTVSIEAVADGDLRIWHLFVGKGVGSMQDDQLCTVLTARSPSNWKMMLDAVMPPPPAPPAEWVELDNRMRLWAAGVRVAVADVLSLGRPFEVQYSVIKQPPLPQFADQSFLSNVGISLLKLFNTDVVRVKDAWPPSMRIKSRLTSYHGAPTGAAITAVASGDFVVAINGQDITHGPTRSMLQIHRHMNAAYSAALAASAPGSSVTVVTLRLVRVEPHVLIDPTRRLTHGHALHVLANVEALLATLKRQYHELVHQNLPLVVSRLSRQHRLHSYLEHLTNQIRDAIQLDERFRFAALFQEWYIDQVSSLDLRDADEDTDDDEEITIQTPPIYEIDSDDDMEDEDEEHNDQSTSVASRAPSTASSTLPPARNQVVLGSTRQSVHEKLRALGAENPDLQWRDVLSPAEMKWLPSARIVLTNFIEGTVDGFVSDGFWNEEMATRVRAIAEHLVTLYSKKLQTTAKDNVTIKKEFMAHARMLRSNICNTKNALLRADLLCGVVSVEKLCSMSSEELAPESLQAERQRLHERSLKEVTITAPTGPRIVKTKHGIKEVDTSAGSSQPSDPVEVPPTPVDRASGSGAFSAADDDEAVVETRSRGNSGATDEVVQRLEAMNVSKAATPPPPPPSVPVRTDPEAASQFQPRVQPRPHPGQPSFSVDSIRFTAADTANFLRAMFDPAQDMEGTIHQLQKAVAVSGSVATFSHEFILAHGVNLYRDLAPVNGSLPRPLLRARVRVLHWTCEKQALSDQQATLGALGRLVNELRECRRLFGGLLEELRVNPRCNFPQPRRNRSAYLEAINVTIRNGLKTSIQPMRHRDGTEMFHVSASIDRLELAVAINRWQPQASEQALHDAMALLSELVALSMVQQPLPTEQPVPHPTEANRSVTMNHVQAQLQPSHTTQQDRSPHTEPASSDRKRPAETSNHRHGTSGEYEPPLSRRKTEEPAPRSNTDRETAPVFFVDAQGESTRQPAPSKEQLEKDQVDAYQQLVSALFRNYDDVKARMNALDWDPAVPERTVEFSSRLTVTRKITRTADQLGYRCEVTGFNGNLCISQEAKALDAAKTTVMDMLAKWLSDVRADWAQIAGVYQTIMKRKAAQKKGQQADHSLSAANETRNDRNVARFVRTTERKIGMNFECKIEVRRLLAIRQVCMNAKIAKRSAGDEFRKLLEWIVRNAPSTTSHRAPPVNPPARSTATASMMAYSDDSDFEGDELGGGDSQGEDDDWQPKPAAKALAAAPPTKSVVQAVLTDPYPLASEAEAVDASRLRAVVRSLFTPEDNLCTGISRIRRALQYHGWFSTNIVPNVRTSIRLVKEGYDLFDVHVSLNDVVTFTAHARSKEEACNRAVDGLLDVLDAMRRVWVQLLHFFHVRVMGTHDVLESFQALRLANIASIDTRIEPSPGDARSQSASRVHCAMYVAGKVVYRVDSDSEDAAHRLATAKTTRFLIDLIDEGLDKDEETRDPDFVPMQQIDWRCTLSLQHYVDQSKRVEFVADACWAIAGRAPVDFVLPARATLQQVGRIELGQFERQVGSFRDLDVSFYFRLCATYEHGLFTNRLADYGNKNKSRVFVLEFEVVENADVVVYVFPPGASVNSDSNLFIPRRILPRELADRKAVYGLVQLRRQPRRY